VLVPRNDPANHTWPAATKLDLYVIATGREDTRAAVDAAARLARGLDARVRILAAYVVPYPLPLDKPPVAGSFIERDLTSIAVQPPLEIRCEVCLCRDRLEAIRRALKPESVVVIGGRKTWWPAAGQRMAAALRRDGHQVIQVNRRRSKLPSLRIDTRLRVSGCTDCVFKLIRRAVRANVTAWTMKNGSMSR
jgi:hypothetical protein